MLKKLPALALLLGFFLLPVYGEEAGDVFPPPPPEELERPQEQEPADIPKPDTAPNAAEQEKAPVQQAQQPPAPPPKPKRLPPELARITVNFSDVPLPVFLKAITRQTSVNFILAEGVEQKKITAFLDGVTLEEALQVLLGIKGLAYEKIPGKSHTYLIGSRKEQKPRTITRIFELNYIPLQDIKMEDNSKDAGSRSASGIILGDGSGEGEGSSGKRGEKDGGMETEFVGIIKTLLSDYGKIAVDHRTNSLIITDLPERFPQVEALIRDLDKKSPQVSIEAQLVEINSNGAQKIGLEFGGSNGEIMRFIGPSRYTDYGIRDRGGSGSSQRSFWPEPFSGSGSAFGTAVTAFNPSQGITYGVLSFNEFQILLRAIVTSSKGKILSRPKIMTINNKPAEIRVASDEAIGVVTISNLQGSATSAERSTTGMILRVTPQVNADGYITMVVEPSVSRTVASSIGNFKDPVKRAVKSMVRVKNGNTIVVGGLMDTREEKTVRRVPILGYIPIIGWLFSSQSTTKNNTELAIFLTPALIDN